MKLLLLVALAISASAHAGVRIESDHKYMLFPDGKGVPHLIDLNEIYEESDADIAHNVDTISFHLYTRWNTESPQTLFHNEILTITSSNFLKSRPTRFITHGWRSDQFADACEVIVEAYLAAGDYNIIVVDWSTLASAVYANAVANVPNVAARVSEFIDFLNKEAGLDLATTQVIGHSLGGHVAGLAARGATGTLEGVVALDPAFPGFENASAGKGVDATDATNVQVIHTNGGKLGLAKAVGTSDFYPNGGSRQPGCGLDLIGSCAHSRAYYYFAESILNPTGFSANGVSGVFMGGETLTTAQGSFELDTASSSPYALG